MASTRCYPEKAPKVDEFMDTLSDSTRREIIHYFENFTEEDTASFEEVVRHVDTRTPKTDPAEIRTRLQHVQLPKLAERGWLDYDTRSGKIRYYGHENAEAFLTDLRHVFTG